MNEKARQEEASPFWIEPQRLERLIARVEAPCGTQPDATPGVGSVSARISEEALPPTRVPEPRDPAPQIPTPQVPPSEATKVQEATTVKPWNDRAVPDSPSEEMPKIDLDETVTVVPSASDTESAEAEKSPPDVASENVPTPYQVGTGPIEERLEGLLAWLAANVAPRQAFVTDREGLALAGDAEDATVAAAAEMAGTWEKLRGIARFPEDGTLSVDTSDGACLHLLRAATPWGILHLGFTAQRLIPTATLERVRDAFVRCVERRDQP